MEFYYHSWFDYIMSLTPQLQKPLVETLIDNIMIEYSKKSIKDRDAMYTSMRKSKLDESFKNRLFYIIDIYETIVELTGKKFPYQECFENVGKKILLKYSLTKDPNDHLQLYQYIKEANDDFYKGFIDSLLKTMDLYDNMMKYQTMSKIERNTFRASLEKKLPFENYHQFHICITILEQTSLTKPSYQPKPSINYKSILFEYDPNEMAKCAATGETYIPKPKSLTNNQKEKNKKNKWSWTPNKGLAPRVVQHPFFESYLDEDLSLNTPSKTSSHDNISIGNCIIDSDSDSEINADNDSKTTNTLEEVWDIL